MKYPAESIQSSLEVSAEASFTWRYFTCFATDDSEQGNWDRKQGSGMPLPWAMEDTTWPRLTFLGVVWSVHLLLLPDAQLQSP